MATTSEGTGHGSAVSANNEVNRKVLNGLVRPENDVAMAAFNGFKVVQFTGNTGAGSFGDSGFSTLELGDRVIGIICTNSTSYVTPGYHFEDVVSQANAYVQLVDVNLSANRYVALVIPGRTSDINSYSFKPGL